MISVFIPQQAEFDFYRKECQDLYESVQDKIGDTNSFDFICENTFFYLFTTKTKLIGAIYYFLDSNGELYLNGFANRKMHELNLECLKMSLGWFNCDIYAIARNRLSTLCLRKCGFVKIKRNLYKYPTSLNNKNTMR